MQDHFDSTTFSSTENSSPVLKELQKIIASVNTMHTKFHSADDVFKPFVLGAILNEIQVGLKKGLIISEAPSGLCHYLSQLVLLRRNFKDHVLPTHNLLISSIADNEFSLLNRIIETLESMEYHLSESWDMFGLTSDLLKTLIEEHGPTQKANEVSDSKNRYKAFLVKKILENNLHQKILRLNSINSDEYSNYKELCIVLNPIKSELIKLNTEAQSSNLDDIVKQISEVIKQIDGAKMLCIKKQLDKHIELLGQNLWSSIDVKKNLYSTFLDLMELFLTKASSLPLSEIEKHSYINQLHTGFELCLDPRFLVTMLQCVPCFYSDNPEKTQELTDYVIKAKASIKQSSSILKRVRFSENEEKTNDGNDAPLPLLKKRALSKPPVFEQEKSSNVKSFINILNPILKPGDTHLSKPFCASLLMALGKSIWVIEELSRTIKTIINYDMLILAQQLSSNKDEQLYQALKNQLAKLNVEKRAAIIKDYVRYNTTAPKNYDSITHDEFRSILSELTIQLSTYIPNTSLNSAIEKFLNAWKKYLLSDGFIDKLLIEKIMEEVIPDSAIIIEIEEQVGRQQKPHVNSNSVQTQQFSIVVEKSTQERSYITNKSSSLNSNNRFVNNNSKEFYSLSDALANATSKEFDLYLNKARNAHDDIDYIHYLANKDGKGNTPLHRLLSTRNYHNVTAYLNEVKNAFGQYRRDLFCEFLTTQNDGGFTFLHQFAANGDLKPLIEFTDYLKAELNPQAYAQALRFLTKNGYRPFCAQAITGHMEINAFLEDERKYYSIASHDRFFRGNINNRDSQTWCDSYSTPERKKQNP